MSDCGGLGIAVLAAPLLLVVLLVAGVSALALAGARLVGDLAVAGIEFAGTALAAGVRAATAAVTAAGTFISNATSQGAQWASSLFDSMQAGERLRSATHSAYQAACQSLAAAPAGSAARAVLGAAARTVPAATFPGPTAVASGAVIPYLQASSLLSASGVTGVDEPLAASKGTAPASSTGMISGGNVPIPADTALQTLAQAQAISAALESELPLKLVAERWYAADLASARAAVASAKVSLRAGQLEEASRHASRAESLLTTAAHGAHQQLVQAERATVTATVGNTLEDMGYNVRVARAKEGVALVGRRGHHVLAMVLRPGGQVEMDMAGFEGNSCDLETKALLEGLRRNGLIISTANITRHGRFEGGALIRRAQRSGKSLEAALAEMAAAVPTREETAPATESAPVRRRGRLPGACEEDRLRQARAWLWQQGQVNAGGQE